MTTAQIIGQTGIIMITAPLIGWGFYLLISKTISDYKYAKFRDKVDKTDYQVKHVVGSTIAILWIIIAGILMITACLMASN
jgi:hypothetical protein